MDKEERQNIQKQVYRMESIGFSLPPSRELVGLVGGEWKRNKGWGRSLIRSRGKIQTLKRPSLKIRKFWDPQLKPSLFNVFTKGNPLEEFRELRP